MAADQFDYIILGAGAAGLSLAYHLSAPKFSHLNILLIDKDDKNKNDRTWCSWTVGDGPFDHLAEKIWNKAIFRNSKFSKTLDLQPYQYIKIRGIDFYEYTLDKINTSHHITWTKETYISQKSLKGQIQVTTDKQSYHANWVFNSIPTYQIDKSKHNYVDQHFKGWFIKTTKPEFQVEIATLMDFSIPQEDECRFMYVLPTSENEALVEVAIFSNEHLEQKKYNSIIKTYIEQQLHIKEYQIIEEESGNIPMTTFPFEELNQIRCTNIGILGGAAKASTGYAFQHIQEQVQTILGQIEQNKEPKLPPDYYKNRFRWYDNVLLNVLLNQREPLADVFGDLFSSLPPRLILRFLSNKSNILDELRIISKPKKLPFLKAAISEFFKTN